MSYNIDSSGYLSGKLFITRANLQKAKEAYGEETPESSFLDEMDERGPLEEVLEIEHPYWSGCGSGESYGVVLPRILTLTTGTAQLIYTWEGGDSVTGLLVEEGKVTQKKVKMVLED